MSGGRKAREDLTAAVADLRDAVAEAMRLEAILDWLTRVLTKLERALTVRRW